MSFRTTGTYTDLDGVTHQAGEVVEFPPTRDGQEELEQTLASGLVVLDVEEAPGC